MPNLSLDSLLASFTPEQFVAARREISKYLKASLKQRLVSQQTVESGSFAPRRGKGGAMLKGFISRTRSRSDRELVAVGYSGHDAKLARVHNVGLMDRIRSQSGQYIIADYPARPWVGISADDEAAIIAILQQQFNHA